MCRFLLLKPEGIAVMANDQATTLTHAEEAATQSDSFPLHETALLGTYERAEGSQALIRTRRGEIVTVRLGDKVERQQVAAINTGLVVLMRNGKVTNLTMPQS